MDEKDKEFQKNLAKYQIQSTLLIAVGTLFLTMGLVAFSLTITLDLEAVDQSGEVYKFLKNWSEEFNQKFFVLSGAGAIILFIGVWWYERKIKKLK